MWKTWPVAPAVLYSLFLDGYHFGLFLDNENKTIIFHFSGHLNSEASFMDQSLNPYIQSHGHFPSWTANTPINTGIRILNATYL
jgi:hypothetical protein